MSNELLVLAIRNQRLALTENCKPAPMTLSEAPKDLERRFLEAELDSPRADAQILLEWVTGLSAVQFRLSGTRVLTPEQETQLENAVLQRLGRYPLQLIVGEAWFYGLRLEVRPGVLIPRPETEVLVSLALEKLALEKWPYGARVLDIGTGTGAIALALKSERPDLSVWATDINPEALELTRLNAEKLGLEIQALESDLFAALSGRFQVILSNPPYLPDTDRTQRPPELETEPDSSLYSGSDGLELARKLLSQAPRFLEPGGFVLLELDPRNVDALAAEQEGWTSRICADLTGRRRFLWLERS